MGMSGRLVHSSKSDGVTLTATSAAGNYAITNVQNKQPSLKWRSTTDAAQTISGDFGAAEVIGCVVIYNHNISAAGSIAVTLASNSGFSTDVFTKTVDAIDATLGYGTQQYGHDGYGGYSELGWQQRFTIIWFTPISRRYFKVVITDTTNTDEYIEVGRLMWGDFTTIPYRYGSELGWREQTEVIRTRGGALRSDARDPYRYTNVESTVLTDRQAADVLEIFRAAGHRSDVLWSGFPENSDEYLERRYTMLGRLTDYSSSIKEDVGNAITFSIEEGL